MLFYVVALPRTFCVVPVAFTPQLPRATHVAHVATRYVGLPFWLPLLRLVLVGLRLCVCLFTRLPSHTHAFYGLITVTVAAFVTLRTFLRVASHGCDVAFGCVAFAVDSRTHARFTFTFCVWVWAFCTFAVVDWFTHPDFAYVPTFYRLVYAHIYARFARCCWLPGGWLFYVWFAFGWLPFAVLRLRLLIGYARVFVVRLLRYVVEHPGCFTLVVGFYVVDYVAFPFAFAGFCLPLFTFDCVAPVTRLRYVCCRIAVGLCTLLRYVTFRLPHVAVRLRLRVLTFTRFVG